MKDFSHYHKPASDELKRQLNALQYQVTQLEETERPFNNKYWDNKKEGLYVDVVSGEPLFSAREISMTPAQAGRGFTRPLEEGHLTTKVDRRLFCQELKCAAKRVTPHLGHLFDDGPGADKKRFCMNSAALRLFPCKI